MNTLAGGGAHSPTPSSTHTAHFAGQIFAPFATNEPGSRVNTHNENMHVPAWQNRCHL